MAKAKITLTGIAEKAANIKENGSVDLLLKANMSPSIPKGLQALKDTYCIVRVAPKTWKKISDNYKLDSKLLIQGEAGVGINAKGTPYIEVIAFDIGLIENKEKEIKPEPKKQLENVKLSKNTVSDNGVKEISFSEINLPEEFLNFNVNPSKLEEVKMYFNSNGKFDKPIIINKDYQLVDGYKRYVVAKELNLSVVPVVFGEKKVDKTKISESKGLNKMTNSKTGQGKIISEWYSNQPKVDVSVDDIILTENIHLKADNINIYGGLGKYLEDKYLTPVVIRKLDDKKYSLVTGMRSYFVAKIMDLTQIPAIFTDLSHNDFMKERGWKESKN